MKPLAATTKPRARYQRRPASAEAVPAKTASTVAITLLLTSQWDTRLAAMASRNRIVGRQKEANAIRTLGSGGRKETAFYDANPFPNRCYLLLVRRQGRLRKYFHR